MSTVADSTSTDFPTQMRDLLTWLKVLAEPAASIVPRETAANGPQAMGPPAARNPAEEVITTRALQRVGKAGNG